MICLLFAGMFAFIDYRLQKKAKAAADVDYPAYGITGKQYILGICNMRMFIIILLM